MRFPTHNRLRSTTPRVAPRGSTARRRVHGAVRRQLHRACAAPRPTTSSQLQLPGPVTFRRQVIAYVTPYSV